MTKTIPPLLLSIHLESYSSNNSLPLLPLAVFQLAYHQDNDNGEAHDDSSAGREDNDNDIILLRN